MHAFKKKISHKHPQKLWVDKGTEYGEIKKKLQGRNIEVYSTRIGTKSAFAERAIQSLKHIIYCYIEDHGEEFIHKLPQYVSSMNCRVNRSNEKSPRDVKKTDFLSILYNKLVTRYKKLKLKLKFNHNLQMNLMKFRQYLQKASYTHHQ